MFWMILLRMVHIFGAALWVGGAVMSAFFIEPAVRATAPESGKFMQYLMVKRRFSLAMTVFASLTILAGALLFLHDSNFFRSGWLRSGAGIGFSLGALAGIAVYLWGIFVISPAAARMSKLSTTIQASGRPPAGEQLSALQAAQERLTWATRMDTWLILVALLFMATARYWMF